MKKLTVTLLSCFLCLALYAQEDNPTYLLFDFMKVEEGNQSAYWETETFWSKIHNERVKDGQLNSWELWSLTPGGTGQGHQYVTVQVYNDPAKMTADLELMKYAKKAYPNMSEQDIEKKLDATSNSRVLDVRLLVRPLDGTEGEWEMKQGMVATLDFMKVDFNAPNAYDKYEKMESEVYKPWHQQMVNDKAKVFWGVGVIMSPIGSDAYATHLTWNFFNDWESYYAPYNGTPPSEEQLKKMEKGLATRDMKWAYIGTLQMRVTGE